MGGIRKAAFRGHGIWEITHESLKTKSEAWLMECRCQFQCPRARAVSDRCQGEAKNWGWSVILCDGLRALTRWPETPTHCFRLSIAFMELQARLALPLFPHIRVEGLATGQTMLQALELVPFSSRKTRPLCHKNSYLPSSIARGPEPPNHSRVSSLLSHSQLHVIQPLSLQLWSTEANQSYQNLG